MRSIVVAGLFVAATSTQLAHADGLIYQLPKDGTSVTFESTEVLVDGVVEKYKQVLTMSSVGKRPSTVKNVDGSN
jgi:hypothetical protein